MARLDTKHVLELSSEERNLLASILVQCVLWEGPVGELVEHLRDVLESEQGSHQFDFTFDEEAVMFKGEKRG